MTSALITYLAVGLLLLSALYFWEIKTAPSWKSRVLPWPVVFAELGFLLLIVWPIVLPFKLIQLKQVSRSR